LFFKKVAAPAVHDSQFTLLETHRNTKISKCLSDSLQCGHCRICPAALNRRSTAAELFGVQLALMKAFVTCGYDDRHWTKVDTLLR